MMMMNEKTYHVWSYEVLSEFTEPDGGEKLKVRFQVSIGDIHTQKNLIVTRKELKKIIMQGKFKMTGEKTK